MTDDYTAKAEKLINEMDQDATGEPWIPEDGSLIVGIVREITAIPSDYNNEMIPVLSIVEDGTEELRQVRTYHYVLRKRILELRPRIGERIAIKCKGKQPSKDGKREIMIYNVKIEGRGIEDPYAQFNEPALPARRPVDSPNRTADEDDDDLPF